MQYRFWKILLLSVLTILFSCSSTIELDETPIVQSERIIKFSGYDWIVRTSDNKKVGPGPNLFSDSEDNVWVDNQGRMHLKIVQRGGLWYCAGVILKNSLGHGKYIFYVANDVSKLDQNVVGGLFTYLNDNEEIDIEFSKWSNPDNMDSQFAVQPSTRVGNKVRYDLNLTSNLSTHSFNWQPDRIEFFSRHGHGVEPNEDNLIHEWIYKGNDIPPSRGTERLRMNLWLFRGQVPSDAKEHEMIIEKFEYIGED